MTVPSDNSRSGPYIGNNVTTVFGYGFKIVSDAHLNVIITSSDGIDRTLVLGSDYTVSGVGGESGGQVEMTAAPVVGESLTILRNVPFVQETDLENQGAYYAETVEDALDLAAMRDQQLQEQVSRAIKLPASDDPSELNKLTSDLRRVARSADEIDTVAQNVGNVNTVAVNIDDVNTVAGVSVSVSQVASIRNEVVTVAGDRDAIYTVAPVIDEIVTVAGIRDQVVTVHNIATDVVTVAGKADDVTTVAYIASDVSAVASRGADVSSVAAIGADVSSVAGIKTDVSSVGQIAGDVSNVASRGQAVSKVSDNMADVVKVADDIAAVNILAPISADIREVADISPAVSSVAGISGDVQTVADDSASIAALGPISGSIQSVASISGDVSSVADIASDVTSVAGVKADVSTVAGISSDIQTVAADSARIGVVAGISDDVQAVAGISDDVQAVASISADVSDVSDIKSSVVDVSNISTSIVSVDGNKEDIAAVALISGEVSTVAGVSGDISTVAGIKDEILAVPDQVQEAEDAAALAVSVTARMAGGTVGQLLIKNSNDDYDYAWKNPSAGGDMFRATYDPTNIGADAFERANHYGDVPWLNVSGKPATFPPSAHTHTIANITNLQSSLDAKENSANKNTAGGYAGLDASGKLNENQLPAIAIADVFETDSQAAMLALVAENGDICVRSDLNKSFILKQRPASTLANWVELRTPTDAVLSVIGLTGAISQSALFGALGLGTAAYQASGYFATASQGGKADTAVQRAGDTMSGALAYKHGMSGVTTLMGGYGWGDKAHNSISFDLHESGSLDYNAVDPDTGTWLRRIVRFGHDGFVTLTNEPTLAKHPATKGYADTKVSKAGELDIGGYTSTVINDGVKSSGTYTPAPTGSNFRSITNGGSFVLAAPSVTGSYNLTIDITNNASAGAITFTGFAPDNPKGDDLTATNGHKFKLHISKTSVGVTAQLEALQ